MKLFVSYSLQGYTVQLNIYFSENTCISLSHANWLAQPYLGKVKQGSVMFSADSGVVWAVQCFALLKFIIPFVFLISCTLWEMIQHN